MGLTSKSDKIGGRSHKSCRSCGGNISNYYNKLYSGSKKCLNVYAFLCICFSVSQGMGI
jgi:hypothetical protein